MRFAHMGNKLKLIQFLWSGRTVAFIGLFLSLFARFCTTEYVSRLKLFTSMVSLKFTPFYEKDKKIKPKWPNGDYQNYLPESVMISSQKVLLLFLNDVLLRMTCNNCEANIFFFSHFTTFFIVLSIFIFWCVSFWDGSHATPSMVR